jgi:hypothetical protein
LFLIYSIRNPRCPAGPFVLNLFTSTVSSRTICS